jgi:vanillate/3-O-methylgallate O-demethylase
MSESQSLPFSPYEPLDLTLAAFQMSEFGFAMPLEYSGWRKEVMAWKETCSFHAGLNPTFTYKVSGPDATRMLNATCVNNIERLKIGASTHAIMCSEQGNIVAHGMLLRLGENEYLSYWLMPVIDFYAESGHYDVTGEDLTGQHFLFQLAGPKSLEILEAAFGEDFHDIRFLRHRPAEIGATTVGISGDSLNVLRIGMSGTLAYEVHGDIADAPAVHAAITKAGEPFGLERLGNQTYVSANHIENGFPQSVLHFKLALTEMDGMTEHLANKGWIGSDVAEMFPPDTGSYEQGDARFLNPVAVGWRHMIKLDHEFVGREALEPLVEGPKQTIVTLIWNVDDILDTFRSQFETGEEYRLMEFPGEKALSNGALPLQNDKVLIDGKLVGMTMGRMYSYAYRKMISGAAIDIEHNEIGTEVVVIWGDEGTRQKEIRATVAQFPILDLERNDAIDVESIPRVNANAR